MNIHILHDRSFREFLSRSGLFLILLGLLRIFIGGSIPYHTGGREISQKIGHIKKSHDHVEILFLGSSRIRRGVIPALFDSLTTIKSKREGISFNLGAPLATVGENLYLLRNFSKNKEGLHLKTFVIEWVDYYLPFADNYRTERVRYWMDSESFIQQMKLLYASTGLISAIKDDRFTYLTSAFLLRSIGLRRVSSAWMDTLKPDTSLNISRGYAKLFNQHAPLINTQPQFPGNFVYDPLQAGRDRQNASRLHNTSKLTPRREDVELWQGLIRYYADRGIRILLLIPPGLVTGRQLVLARQLPAEHILDLSDPVLYPDLYDPEIYHDIAHFNHDGATRFTRRLAEKFLSLKIDYIKP
jgi:hypothetical protein